MSSVNCTCEYIRDPCRYFKPPDPPPHYNIESIETFRSNHSGWIKYKDQCLHSTSTLSNDGNQGTTFRDAESKVQQDNGLSTGALIGIVISVIACTLIIIIVVVYLVTHPKKRQKLWIQRKSLFQCKGKIITSEVQVTYQKYEEVNYLHSKAVKGECYKNQSFRSEDNIDSHAYTALDGAYTDSNCNQSRPGSNHLTSSSINKNENSPASHHTYSNIPPSKGCLTTAEINSGMTQLSLDRANDCIKGQDETRDTLAKKKPRKKKNHLKRQKCKSQLDLVDEAESLGKEKYKTL